VAQGVEDVGQDAAVQLILMGPVGGEDVRHECLGWDSAGDLPGGMIRTDSTRGRTPHADRVLLPVQNSAARPGRQCRSAGALRSLWHRPDCSGGGRGSPVADRGAAESTPQRVSTLAHSGRASCLRGGRGRGWRMDAPQRVLEPACRPVRAQTGTELPPNRTLHHSPLPTVPADSPEATPAIGSTPPRCWASPVAADPDRAVAVRLTPATSPPILLASERLGSTPMRKTLRSRLHGGGSSGGGGALLAVEEQPLHAPTVGWRLCSCGCRSRPGTPASGGARPRPRRAAGSVSRCLPRSR
jgi:hypothetical protein